MEHKDCFAHSKKGCNALTYKQCVDRECNFYKTKEQRDEEWKKYPPINYDMYKNTGDIVKLKD